MENYEQKYKEALEQAKKELDACGSMNCDAARQIFRLFPELKKSEDELVKAELIHFLEICQDTHLVANRKRDKWIEWLEKQGEQKQVSITDEWIEDYWQHEKVNNPNSYDKGDEIQFDHDGFIRFCKKYCQKPTWSGEDESMFACLWGILNWVEKSNYSSAKNVGKYIEWLQSLKQRLNGTE